MAEIAVYITDISGLYSHKRVGNAEDVGRSLVENNEAFTLSPPPDIIEKWYWNGKNWQDEPLKVAE